MWFWRGTQSAIFYYATCSPCMEYNHKRKRRKEARAAAKERAALELAQPDMIRQPMAFTTNRYWAEEIEAGPGPPKGRRRDSLAGDLAQTTSKNSASPKANENRKQKSVFADRAHTVTFSEPVLTASSSAEPAQPAVRPHRLSLDQKPSTFDTLKETLRSSLSPETWNRKRYEREDEPLWGLNDAMSRMWDRARPSHHRSGSAYDPSEPHRSFPHGRRRVDTTDRDRFVYDYSRARHPEVNDLHPPVVSQLPATKAEVAWMLQPPPSRAVMEGKVRPGAEDMSLQRPLAVIGTPKAAERRRAPAAPDKRGVTERIEQATDEETPRHLQRAIRHGRAMGRSEEESEGGEAEEEAKKDEEVEEGEDEEEAKDEEERETGQSSPSDLKPARRASLPHIYREKALSKTTIAGSEPSPQPLQRPPLAVIASKNTTRARRTFTVPAAAPKLSSPNASPTSPHFAPGAPRALSDITNQSMPPEWEYLLECVSVTVVTNRSLEGYHVNRAVDQPPERGGAELGGPQWTIAYPVLAVVPHL